MYYRLTWLLFLAFSLTISVASAQDVKDGEKIKVDTRLVSVPVIVSDRNNRYVPGLTAKDFTIAQDGVPQTIEFFGSTEEPLTIALLIDTSLSTRPVLSNIKESAKAFIKLLLPQDRAMVVSFDYQFQVLSPLTSDPEQLRRAVMDAEIPDDFGTVMRDAAHQTIRRSLAGIKGRKAVILLTDGKDAGSYISPDDLLYALQESDTLVYTIMFKTGQMMRKPDPIGNNGGWGNRYPRRGGGFPDDFPHYPRRGGNPRRAERVERKNREAAEFLNELSETTAGRFFESSDGKLKKTFESIVEELRFQYRLGFYPPVYEKEATLHQLKVKVARSDAVVRSRSSYRVLTDQN